MSGEGQAKLELPGRQKAALLLVSVGQDAAAEVLRHLRQEEIESVSLEMARIHHVPPHAADAVLGEILDTALAYESYASGGIAYAREVLERAVGAERTAEVMGRLSAVIEMRPFEFLRRTPPEQIAAFLRTESAQTTALVIAHLHTTLASQVLAELPPADQVEVAVRIAQMSETSPDVIKEVESVMRARLSNVLTQDEYAAAGGVKSLADILNRADQATERNVLEMLATTNAELAEQIRMLLFVFEDIVKLEDRAVQLVLREIDQKDLALAVRGVSDDVREKVFKNLSQRAADMLREEIEVQPPQPKRVVEEAQGKVVAAIRRLEEAGELHIGRGSGDDELL